MCREVPRALLRVQGTIQEPIDPTWIRVPLDFHRTGMRSLQWLSLFLSELSTGGQVELLSLLREIRSVQLHTRRALPLLVDMNIHYRIMKMMYSVNCVHLDTRQWLSAFPVLYGVWHPYKYCLNVVYRKFFPIFILLETTGHAVGKEVNCQRKVLHIEKLVACLLLTRHRIADRLQAKFAASSGAATSTTSVHHHQWLQGLSSLIDHFCPMLFQLGAAVRECTWSGREPNSGHKAKTLLINCLALFFSQLQGFLMFRL